MIDSRRVVWLIVMVLAGLGFLAEFFLVEISPTEIALCALGLGVMIFAYLKQRGDGKTLQPVRPHDKSRREREPRGR